MDLFKVILIFIIILCLILMKRKLSEAIIAAVLCTIVFFRIPVLTAIEIAFKSLYEKYTLIVLGSFILVTFLQRIMEGRHLLERAELALQRLSGNRRLVCIIAPVVIGFLPSAGAVNICGSIVDGTVKDDMDVEQKTFVTSYYRHISESFSPTYNAILLALSLTLVPTGSFVLRMAPMVVVLILLGYVFQLRKIDKNYETKHTNFSRMEELKQLLYCFWPLFACIIIVIAFNLQVITVLPFIIFVSIFVYRLKSAEVLNYVKHSFEYRILSNTVILMIFKNLLTYTGVISRLPDILGQTNLPDFIALGIIMVLGTIISGATSMIVLLIPIAFEMIPNGGASLLMYLMALSYAAMQISPTHICLAVIAEYFHVDWGGLIRKTLPVILSFLVILNLYYIALMALGI